VVFAPAGPSARAYNDPPRLPAPASPLGDALVALIDELSAGLGKRPPRSDGRLFRAAAELAEVVPLDGPLPYQLVEFALQHHGIIEPSPHLLVIWADVGDPSAIVAELRPRLARILAASPFARIGVGAVRRGQEDAIVLALQQSFLRTGPIPRVLPAHGTLQLDGSVLEPFAEPQVYVTRGDGSVEQTPVERRGRRRFRARVVCGQRGGRQQVEITASDASGSTVLANFPVWCGEVPPATLRVEPGEDDRTPAPTEEAAEMRLVELVNRDRARFGLPPLVPEPRLRRVARAHCREMASTGLVAHVSPTTGDAADRVRAAGIPGTLVLENVARAYGVAEAQEGLMGSPGHRANILSAQATHIGVGIVFGKVVAGRREMLVTQLFTRAPEVAAPEVAQAQLAALVERRLGVEHDPELSRIAAEQATNLARGLASSRASQRAGERLEALATRYRQVVTTATTVLEVESIPLERVAPRRRRPSHYGLGVAAGPHAALGERALFVVLLLASARR
jgi:uncharacterized protein YkwD